MQVFISFDYNDSHIADYISTELKKAGHSTIHADRVPPSSKRLQEISKILEDVDAAILIVNQLSLRSEQTQSEFSLAAVSFSNKPQKNLIALTTDGTSAPEYLLRYDFLDASTDPVAGIERIVKFLSTNDGSKKPKTKNAKSEIDSPKTVDSNEVTSRRNNVRAISNALKQGRLTLVCGAGVSVDAGVPAWHELLGILLERMFRKLGKAGMTPASGTAKTDIQSRYSSLIMGRYLKNNLGSDFKEEVRSALYSNEPTIGKIINSIVKLARPQRDSQPLDSILTFNFDDLIEQNLQKNNIAHRAVHGEGERTKPHELPVYHVHGYLPQVENLPPSDIVFSEDAYHNQFIEPFSWSNLIQLNKLNDRTCLFVGLSLSDPNLRRLLDVAHRKNPDELRNHYIIKKRPSPDDDPIGAENLILLLEEQDANSLGLNVLWVDDFDEISLIIDEIDDARSTD